MTICPDSGQATGNDHDSIVKYLVDGYNNLAQKILNHCVKHVDLPTAGHLNTENHKNDKAKQKNQNEIHGSTSGGREHCIEKIIMNQNTLNNHQNILLVNQQKATAALVNLFGQIETQFESGNTTMNVQDDLSKRSITGPTLPMQNLIDLEYFEQHLSSEEAMQEYKRKYSVACVGPRPLDCANRLIDIFFTKQFLAKCSWTGSCRSEGTKICLKSYKNVLSLFHELIYIFCPTYTIEDNNNFFKSSLKYNSHRLKVQLQKEANMESSHNINDLSDLQFEESDDLRSADEIAIELKLERNDSDNDEEANNVLDLESSDPLCYTEQTTSRKRRKSAEVAQNAETPTNEAKRVTRKDTGNSLSMDVDHFNTIKQQLLVQDQTVPLEHTQTTANNKTTECNKNDSFSKILNNQKSLQNNFDTVLKEQSKMILMIEEFSEKINNSLVFDTSMQIPIVLAENRIPETRTTPLGYKPIDNKLDFDNFEELLQHDDTARAMYKKEYSKVCSPGKGLNCAYQLVDVFFTREFMTQCSWSGGSRGEAAKICFKKYTHVMRLFFDLVYHCDPTYTIEENSWFFKTLLRNSKKRMESKFQRASTLRNRKRNKNTNQRTMECVVDNAFTASGASLDNQQGNIEEYSDSDGEHEENQ